MQSQINTGATDLKEMPRTQKRSLEQPLINYVEMYSIPREGMKKAFQTGDNTMQQIANAFVHHATVSRAVKKNIDNGA